MDEGNEFYHKHNIHIDSVTIGNGGCFMNKEDNKLALSVLSTLATGILLIYTLIMFHDIIFAVVGVSVIFLISAFVLTQQIISYSANKSKSLDQNMRDCAEDISTQIESMHNQQSQLSKATFLYTKQAAQAVSVLENNYTESQEALYKNLASLSSAQNKATKLMIKYDQTNTTKVISSIRDLRNQLSDTMIQGFDQIQPNNDEVVSALNDIVTYLKSQPNNHMDQALGLQLNSVAHELQNISNSIQHVQIPMQTMLQQASMAAPVTPATPVAQEAVVTPEETVESLLDSLTSVETSVSNMVPEMEAVVETTPEEPMVENVESVTETTPDTVEASSDSNSMLSQDEIAALFAAAEPTPAPAEQVEEEEEKPFTPTFTVVGKSTEEEAQPTIGSLTDDPNKQLSADEIAALFAAADPVPKKEPAPEPVKVEPITDDPNKQLSADEIAALFAAADPAPKKEPEPVKIEPVSDDPNKQLSPEEIAALFASLG